MKYVLMLQFLMLFVLSCAPKSSTDFNTTKNADVSALALCEEPTYDVLKCTHPDTGEESQYANASELLDLLFGSEDPRCATIDGEMAYEGYDMSLACLACVTVTIDPCAGTGDDDDDDDDTNTGDDDDDDTNTGDDDDDDTNTGDDDDDDDANTGDDDDDDYNPGDDDDDDDDDTNTGDDDDDDDDDTNTGDDDDDDDDDDNSGDEDIKCFGPPQEGDKHVYVCHATASDKKPYRQLCIARKGWEHGHKKGHKGALKKERPDYLGICNPEDL